uniref:Restriction endonuclease subunit R n=1 Tax=Cyanothece sp. (strain PCC 7425 / ATCC 29141) TaxID=395961 RepID=B8HQU8_CYAP4
MVVDLGQVQNQNLRDLIDTFGIRLVEDEQFFPEWQTELPELSNSEIKLLDRVKEGFLNLAEYPPILEKSFQLSVISPLLLLAGFYLPPFHMKAEELIEITSEDEGTIVRGFIDILIVKTNFWIMVIESKQTSYSIEVGLAQILAYMLAKPQPEKPCFGMIAAGGNFIFVKMIQDDRPYYALSDEFTLRRRQNELYSVLQILKRLGDL